MVYGLHHSTEKGMTTYHAPIGADERTVTIQHSKEVGHDHVINLPTTFLITGSLRHDPLLIRNAPVTSVRYSAPQMGFRVIVFRITKKRLCSAPAVPG